MFDFVVKCSKGGHVHTKTLKNQCKTDIDSYISKHNLSIYFVYYVLNQMCKRFQIENLNIRKLTRDLTEQKE